MCHHRPAIEFSQFERVERLAVLEHLGVDNPGWCFDIAIDAVHSELTAVFLVAPHVVPTATDPQIDLAHRHRPALWAQQPATHMFGFGERREDKTTRGVESPGSEDFQL